MKRLFVLLGLVCFVIGLSLAAAEQIPAGKEKLEFKVALGTVTFEHKTHAVTRSIACVTCHHTAKGEQPPKGCHECHGKTAQGKVPNLQQAIHKTCGDCHKAQIAQGKKAPDPLKCAQCHVKAKPA